MKINFDTGVIEDAVKEYEFDSYQHSLAEALYLAGVNSAGYRAREQDRAAVRAFVARGDFSFAAFIALIVNSCSRQRDRNLDDVVDGGLIEGSLKALKARLLEVIPEERLEARFNLKEAFGTAAKFVRGSKPIRVFTASEVSELGRIWDLAKTEKSKLNASNMVSAYAQAYLGVRSIEIAWIRPQDVNIETKQVRIFEAKRGVGDTPPSRMESMDSKMVEMFQWGQQMNWKYAFHRLSSPKEGDLSRIITKVLSTIGRAELSSHDLRASRSYRVFNEVKDKSNAKVAVQVAQKSQNWKSSAVFTKHYLSRVYEDDEHKNKTRKRNKVIKTKIRKLLKQKEHDK